jgi:UDP-N-acetylmuramate--alanine ligase
LNAFYEFLNNTKKNGCVFVCSDDINLKNAIKGYKNRYVLFGLENGAQIYPKNIETKELTCAFDCFYKDNFIDRFSLALGGRHNVSNALAVIALGLELGLDLGVIKKTLSDYKGAKRRLEIKFYNKDYLLVDDYAHHPTEIRATLAALKNFKFDRLIAIFQPHRYTRTKLLLDEFSKSFDLVDYIIITDIYPAGEKPIKGISGRLIFDKIKEHLPRKQLDFLPKEKIVRHILENIKPKDLVVTLGAGDIVKTCDELVEEFKRKS